MESGHFAFKLPSGKEIDVMKIIHSKSLKISQPSQENPEKTEETVFNSEKMESLIKGVEQFAKAGRESKESRKITQKQSFYTNQYLNNKVSQTDFERIKVGSLEPSLISEEVKFTCKHLSKVLKLRYKYLFQHHQQYSNIEKLIIHKNSTEPMIDYTTVIPPLSDLPNELKLNEGVYEVIIDEKSTVKVPHMFEFIHDLAYIIEQTHNSSNKTFCHNRLEILEEKFKLHLSYNRERETLQTQAISHRDFYNCRKIDTHVHHSACMRAKQLLEFIIHKMETEPNTNVMMDKQTKNPITLKEICDKTKISNDNINLDSLNVQADSSIFQRFDRFNDKYNPLGVPDLREIFLKNDNFIKGRFLAELTKEVLAEMEKEKYCFSEWRISIYGRNISEWHILASWVISNKISSHQLRWMIQIPRLFKVYCSLKIIHNFQEMIDNIFKPLFEVSLNPSKDPDLYQFLFQVVGFDTVDDESTYEVLSLEHLALPPVDWQKEENPHYAYWIYYIYANISSLNELRRIRGLNTFSFRPHCGESGNVDHLATAFLVADGINHGIRLNSSPVLQYIYYLKQIGIAMSPLSNNKLFLEYSKNPFPKFFGRGLNVSLSTDDPLIIHLTKEPLLEEYAVAAQVWNLSTVDLCEIARNSVIQSSYEEFLKKHWIGEKYNHRLNESNDSKKTNVPQIRFLYRLETLREEEEYLMKNLC